MLSLMPLNEAAKSLGIAPSTLRHQLRLGRFVARKIGPRWYVTPDEVARYRLEVQGKREGSAA